jgi:hypothetical protein
MSRTPLHLKGPVAFVLLVLTGCQQGTATLAPVHGKVLYHGVVLQSGTIVFTPDASRGGSGPLAHAEIQADGTYSLRSGQGFGAVPGWHRVTVAAVYAPVNAQGYAVPQSLVPDRYRDPQLSGLVCEVKRDQPNVFDFNLE